MRNQGVFITGTDTGVGKTWVSCGLLRAAVRQNRRAVGMKPVASGCVRNVAGEWISEDLLALQAAGNVTAALPLLSPYALALPVSPHIAALDAGVTVDMDVVQAAWDRLAAQSDWRVVEGAGGWLAPLSEQFSMADLAVRMGLPVVLVVGLRLGCLNHALLTERAIRGTSVPYAGWVANPVEADMLARQSNVEYLRKHLTGRFLGECPNQSDARPEGGESEACFDALLQALFASVASPLS